MAADTPVTSELSRDLGLFSLTMIGVGAMIGAGIFVLTGIAAGYAGPALILAFCLNGVVAFFTALVYAELGSAIPEAGGGYLWVKEGLPGSNAFMAGWMSWFAHAVVGAVYALGFGAYMNWILEVYGVNVGIPGEIFVKLLAVLIAIAFVGINFKGVSETGAAGNIVTIGKIVILGLFIASGIIAIVKEPIQLREFSPFTPNGIGGVVTAMGFTFIAFEGYEIIAQAGEEVKNPHENIPKAIFLSMAIVIPIYILVAFVAIGAVQQGQYDYNWQWLSHHEEMGLAEAAKAFMPFGTILLLIGGVLSTMSALNATTYSSTRVSFAMGRDKNLPDLFARIHHKTRVPHFSLIFSGIFIIIFCVFVPIETVAFSADIMFLLLFTQVNIALITIRKKYGKKLKYGYVIPAFHFIAITGIVLKFALAVFMFITSPEAWIITIIWLAIGFVIFSTYASKREREKTVTPVARLERTGLSDEGYSILVPIAHKLDIEYLTRYACSLAEERRGKVIVLHVVTLPHQLPLSEGYEYAAAREVILREALKKVKKEGIEAEGLIRIARDPALAIVDTIEERKCDVVVMGWHGRSRFSGTTVGSTIDTVIKKANSNVIALELRQDIKPKKIFAPVDKLKGADLVLRSAIMLGKEVEGSYIDLYHIYNPSESVSDRKKFKKDLMEIVKDIKKETGYKRIRYLTDETYQVYEEIIDKSYDYDVAILGSGKDTWFSRKIHDSRVQYIASETDTPLVLTRRKASRVRFSLQNYFQFFKDIAKSGEGGEDE